MTFNRVSKYAEKSDCHRYAVAAVRVNGIYHFEAWRLTDSPSGVFLGVDRSASRARDLCVADAAARASRSSMGEAA